MTIRRPLTWLVIATLLPVVACAAILVAMEVRHQRAAVGQRLAQQA